jgi:hypothetical protein
MADPKAAKKKWKQFYIGIHKILQLHVGSDNVIIAFIYAYTTDLHYCAYQFLEQSPTAVAHFLDTFSVGDEGLYDADNPRGTPYAKRMAYSWSEIAMAGAVGFHPAIPTGLDELTGGHMAGGKVSFAVQRRDKFVGDDATVRMEINAGPKGRSPITFAIPFHTHNLPPDIGIHPVAGNFAQSSGVVSSLREAQAIMDEQIRPYLAGPRPPPLINLRRFFDLRP